MPSLVILQPDPEAPPGLLVERFVAGGAVVAVHEMWDGVALSAASASCDGLVVLGATAPAVDDSGETAFPALLDLLRSRVADRRPILGLGLGAQLLALALGGAIRPAAAPEFGYVDLVPTGLAAADPVVVGIGAGLPLMLWHDDGIDLPTEVQPLAHCHRGRVLAFRAGEWAYGLQFHAGATVDIVRRWAMLRGRARNNPAVPVRIGAEIVRHQERAERFGGSVAEGWLKLVAG